jgi:hypothetical protein
MEHLRRWLQLQLHEDAAQPPRCVDGVGEDQRPSRIALQEVVDGGVLKMKHVGNLDRKTIIAILESLCLSKVGMIWKRNRIGGQYPPNNGVGKMDSKRPDK